MDVKDISIGEKAGFRFVCANCGSLSIKIANPANAPDGTLVLCGRCDVVRGTLGELHDLARRSVDMFEF
jgi:hypothetical protein